MTSTDEKALSKNKVIINNIRVAYSSSTWYPDPYASRTLRSPVSRRLASHPRVGGGCTKPAFCIPRDISTAHVNSNHNLRPSQVAKTQVFLPRSPLTGERALRSRSAMSDTMSRAQGVHCKSSTGLTAGPAEDTPAWSRASAPAWLNHARETRLPRLACAEKFCFQDTAPLGLGQAQMQACCTLVSLPQSGSVLGHLPVHLGDAKYPTRTSTLYIRCHVQPLQSCRRKPSPAPPEMELSLLRASG